MTLNTNIHTNIKSHGRIQQIWHLVALLAFVVGNASDALTFSLSKGQDIVGHIQTTYVEQGESLGDIGRKHDMGVYEMMEANPHLDPWVPMTGAEVIIPAQFILPPGPREGIVLNLAEMRLYFYHPNEPLVTTFPVGIGKKGWSTPLGQSVILGKQKDPAWTPPASIRAEHANRGDILPAVVPAGPNNPLGQYAFRLGFPGFLLHGTNRPGGVGVRSSHGCVRLLPEDIKTLYHLVPVGTKIRIIHAPFKLGWKNNSLYLEAHQPLSEPKYQHTNSLSYLKRLLQDTLGGNFYHANWSHAEEVVGQSIGYPVKID
jgi:L,D-transpeptidase ErfK/SrfK